MLLKVTVIMTVFSDKREFNTAYIGNTTLVIDTPDAKKLITANDLKLANTHRLGSGTHSEIFE